MHKVFYTFTLYTIAVLAVLAYGGITGKLTYEHHEEPVKVKQLARSVFAPIDGGY